MDMSITNCWDCGPDTIQFLAGVALLFFAPIGAFVLRRHIAAARGFWKVAGRALQAMAIACLPIDIIVLLGALAH
jgi:hypothetical protein